MTTLRALAKEAIYGAAAAAGLPRLAGAHRGPGLIVLTYHSFGPAQEHPYLHRLPPARFAAQLRYLQTRYDLVSLEQGLARLAAGAPAARPMVAITVDDGYGDNYEHLFPIVRAAAAPITIFVATDYLDTGALPWPTQISALLHFSTAPNCPLSNGAPLPLQTRADKHAAGRALRQELRGLSHQARKNALQQLEQALQPRSMRTLPPLTWAQIRTMRDAGISFGSHTRFHGWLDCVDAAECERELSESRARIQAELQHPCTLIAYPNGNNNCAVRQAAARAGYRHALTQQRGINRTGLDPFALARIEIPYNEQLGAFACRVAGLAL